VSFDNSRFTFDPWKNFSGVVMEQGRVQLDADWNEWLAEVSRRIQANTLDIMGHAVYPATTPYGFLITLSSSGGKNSISIGPGRMYVDGLLAENHGQYATAQWDPALAEMSGSPQPQPPSPPPASTANVVDYANQPYYPGATLPTDNGQYIFYLDVWSRPITWLEDPHLIDKAVGVDTTGRLQTVWQVKYMSNSGGWTCSTPDSQIWPPPTPGVLTTDVVPNASSGPCCLTAGTSYTGVENQFYRVEIHQNGASVTSSSAPTTYPVPAGIATATFKWSRENASVQTGVTAITSGKDTANATVSVLSVMSLGRDQVLGFSAGDWIEILDDWSELWGNPGVLCQIDQVNVSPPTITLTSTLNTTSTAANTDPPSFPIDSSNTVNPNALYPDRHTRVRRWDQKGKVYESDGKTVWVDLSVSNSTGDIPVPPPGTTLILEDGITVTFNTNSSGGAAGGAFNVGDFWTFAARTADGSVEKLAAVPPRGIHHHYTKLSTVNFSVPSAPDCRTEWPPATSAGCSGCCTYTVGQGGEYSTIQAAISNLPSTGGEICILPGRYFEHVFIYNLRDVVIHGCGAQTRIASPSLQTFATVTLGGSTTIGDKLTLTMTSSAIAGSPVSVTYTVTASDTLNSIASNLAASLNSYTVLSAAGISASASLAVVTLTSTSSLNPSPVWTGSSAGLTAAGTETVTISSAPASTNPIVTPESGFAAVITVVESAHIELRSFAVEAADGEAGILLDGVAYNAEGEGQNTINKQIDELPIDITIQDLVLTASTLPAIVAVKTYILKITGNRIAMKDVASQWAAIYVSGIEIHVDHNWIGLQDANPVAEDRLPGIVVSDVSSGFYPTSTPSTPAANGGIHIAGSSGDVFILDNEIEGGAFNAITLGNFTLVSDGIYQNTPPTGLFPLTSPVETAGTTLMLPATDSKGNQVVMGNPLQNIQIARNRIRTIGLCGIGPVGFFNLATTQELVNIQNLTITSNTISTSLQNAITPFAKGITGLGYGAICLPDVQNLILRDNTITDFGSVPGAQVCGIFLCSGEQVEISRNQVIETRDWSGIPATTAAAISGAQGGIVINAVSPPSLDQTATAAGWTCSGDGTPPMNQPGLPALRVEENVVRVPLGLALGVAGAGPFSIVNNHLSSGGTVPAASTSLASQSGMVPFRSTQFPTNVLTVEILNIGIAIDVERISPGLSVIDRVLSKLLKTGLTSSSGAVLFANNICQLETRASGATGLASVAILTLDHLTFTNNHCWIDSCARREYSADSFLSSAVLMDAVLVAASLQVCGNRLQESAGSVAFSGLTAGVRNITAQNITSYCLYTLPASSSINNISFSPKGNCDDRLERLIVEVEALLASSSTSNP
jgi:hypothetical protein